MTIFQWLRTRWAHWVQHTLGENSRWRTKRIHRMRSPTEQLANFANFESKLLTPWAEGRCTSKSPCFDRPGSEEAIQTKKWPGERLFQTPYSKVECKSFQDWEKSIKICILEFNEGLILSPKERRLNLDPRETSNLKDILKHLVEWREQVADRFGHDRRQAMERVEKTS